MSWIIIIWSTASGACLVMALMHLLVWSHDRRSWANLCFSVMVLGVIGLAIAEMVTMHTESPEVFGRAVRWSHLIYGFGVTGSLGFVHFYFGTGRRRLLALALSEFQGEHFGSNQNNKEKKERHQHVSRNTQTLPV